MDSNGTREIPGPAALGGPVSKTGLSPIIEFHEVSKWYGNVIGINKLSLRIGAGVTADQRLRWTGSLTERYGRSGSTGGLATRMQLRPPAFAA